MYLDIDFIYTARNDNTTFGALCHIEFIDNQQIDYERYIKAHDAAHISTFIISEWNTIPKPRGFYTLNANPVGKSS